MHPTANFSMLAVRLTQKNAGDFPDDIFGIGKFRSHCEEEFIDT
jgi:hypothetical protein